MLALLWVALLVGVSAFVLIYQGLALLWAAQMPRRTAPPGPPPAASPQVSVIVPARNEEVDLPACLDGLLAQTYPALEITVVDGGSTDRTPDVVRARAPRVTLIDEAPLPPGWVGKSWACQQGADRANGKYVLFTDADVRYDPNAVWTAVEWAEAEGADLVTFATRVEMVGFWENVVLPFYIQMVLTYFRAPRVNRPESRAAMANGQFLLVRADTYRELRGHAAIRDRVLEDVALAEQFRRAGKRLRIAWTPELVTTRMYRTRAEMFEGILKTVSGVRFSAARQLLFAVALVGLYWLPLAVLPVGVLTGSAIVTGLGAGLAVALLGKHAVFARSARGSAAYGLLFPVAVGVYVWLVLIAFVRGLRHRPVVWKGRAYPLGR
jgi:chlorobactene glucosyltransferase